MRIQRKIALFLLIAGLAGSCAHAPPSMMVADRIWYPNRTGYTFRAGYYSEAEVRDARWERGRIEMMREQGIICHPVGRIVRRDVRWYPATPLSGRRCAALVYTVSCGHENFATGRMADDVRRELLASEPERPIGRDCGIKDYYYYYHPEDCAPLQNRPEGCQRRLREQQP